MIQFSAQRWFKIGLLLLVFVVNFTFISSAFAVPSLGPVGDINLDAIPGSELRDGESYIPTVDDAAAYPADRILKSNTTGRGLSIPIDDPDIVKINRSIVTDRTFGDALLTMVNYFAGFLGFLATIMFIYAGVLWVLNAGSEEMITKAKKIMTYASLGLVVIILSFSIVRFITQSGEKTISGFECRFQWDCPEGEWCVLNSETRVYACSSDVRAAFDQECQETADCTGTDSLCVAGKCVESNEVNQLDFDCFNVEDCDFANGEVCWDNVCQLPPDRPRPPFECFGSFHCAPGEYCSAVGRCQPSNNITCQANSDCDAPKTCDQYGFCRNPNANSSTSCSNGSDCASGYVCNLTTNRCSYQSSGIAGGGSTGTGGITGTSAGAATDENLDAIEDLLDQANEELTNIGENLDELPAEDREEILGILGEGSILDKVGRLEDMLGRADNPATARALERIIAALGYLISMREEMDELRQVMPESTETIADWDETSKALNDVIDDPDSSIKLRRFETKYRKLRDSLRRFPVVQARINAAPAEGNVPFTVTLDGMDSADPTGGTISDYRWTFLDNQGNEVSLGNSPVIIHEFTEPNTYVVRLTASTSQRDDRGYRTAADGISTVRVMARPPTSSINFRINSAQTGDVHRVTVKEAQAGITFDPSGTVPALGRTIKKYEWAFGDTATETRSTPTSVVHTYQKPGEYFVKLTVEDSHGVKDYRIVKLLVKSLAAEILVNPLQGNVNTEFSFRGIESRSDDGSINYYDWSLEDSESRVLFESEEQAFSYKFDRPGEYRVKLMVTDIAGARDSAVETVKVISRKPVAGFVYSVPEANHPNRIEFDALTSYDPDEGDTLVYSWDFDGDGTFEIVDSGESRTTYEYRRTGNYRVRLQVQDAFGERDLIERSVPIDSVLSADITLERRAVQAGQEVKFSAASSNAVAYLWEFGDGETLSTEDASATHVYNRKGRYTVKLHFFDNKDNEGVDQTGLLVGNSDHPVAVIGTLINGRDDKIIDHLCGKDKNGISLSRSDNIVFSGGDSVNTDGSSRLLAYDWKFSDGTRDSKKEFTHRFNELNEEGECSEISLVVRDQVGGKVSEPDQIYIKVVNELPEITDFTIESPHEKKLVTPVSVSLRAINPRDSDGTIKRYRWWYYREGDEDVKLGIHSTNVPQTDMVITAVGQPDIKNRYFFVLEITDADGGVYSTLDRFLETSYLDVLNGPNLSPVAEFTMDKTAISAGDSITFVSSSYDPQGDSLPDSAFRWDFDGDGNFDDTSSGSQVNRKYNTPGEYSVRLKVTYRGLSSSATKTIYVEPTQSLPQAAFTYAVEGKTVTFNSGNSRYDPDLSDTTLRYEWDFDVESDADGNGVNDDDVENIQANPSFTYSTVGVYRVRLKVKDMTGAEGVVAREVDLNLNEEERARNSYRSLLVSSPDQPLASLDVKVTPARLGKGGTADISVDVFNADNSSYFGKVFFEVIEGSGEFAPSSVEAKNSKAFTIFNAVDSGLVRIRVKATETTYGDLTEEATIYITQ